MNPEELIDTDQDSFVTRCTFKNGISLDLISKYLCDKKATAELRVEFMQGGRRQIVVTEHTKLKAAEREEVRKLLHMK